jgi:hypothetical protein
MKKTKTNLKKNITKIQKTKGKKKKKKKKTKQSWITTLIHVAMVLDKQWFFHSYFWLIIYGTCGTPISFFF